MRIRVWISAVTMVAMAVSATAYLVLGVFGYSPSASMTKVVVQLPNSGGLMETSPVTLNGLQVGTVTRLAETPDGVNAYLAVKSQYRIPADSVVTVANLSAVGEEYLNFAPKTSAAPYLADGEVVAGSRVVAPLLITQALGALQDLANQLHPNDINKILSSGQQAVDGVQPNIRKLVDAGNIFSTTLRQNRDLIQRMIEFVGSLQVNTGAKLEVAREAADRLATTLTPELPGLLDEVISVVSSSGGKQIMPFMPVVQRFFDYVRMLVADVGGPVLDVIEPMLAQVRWGDANKVMDSLLATFPNGNGLRVLVDIPH